MNRSEVIARLKDAEPELRARGVSALYLYGSYARDEAGPESDIDVLVELDGKANADLTMSLAPYVYLEGQFPDTEIGYGTRENIVPLYLPSIEKSALRIF